MIDVGVSVLSLSDFSDILFKEKEVVLNKVAVEKSRNQFSVFKKFFI